jgi:streptogramin lyase
VRGTSKAPSSSLKSKIPKRLRAQFGVLAALIAVLVLALPAGASADVLGSNSEFFAPEAPSDPVTLTEGSDGNIWFTDPAVPTTLPNKKIGKVTPAGAVTEYSPGLSGGAWSITEGPDGNLWFTEPGVAKVGYIDPSKPEASLKEFSVPNMPVTGGPFKSYIVTGPDGNLWVTLGANGLARVTPAGAVTEYPASTTGFNAGIEVCSIAAGPDGNVWFGDCNGSKPSVGVITPAGAITEYEVKGTPGTMPESIAKGSDGRLWFPANNAVDERIGAITTAGVVTYYKTPTFPASFNLDSLTAGPDGNVWGTETSGENEKQTATIVGEEGLFRLSFEGQKTGWTGKGTLAKESTSVTGVTTTTGSPVVGELVAGSGIKANTRIASCAPVTTPACTNPTSITLSQKTTSGAGGEQSLSADLGLSPLSALPSSAATVKTALEKLSAIATKVTVIGGSSFNPPTATRGVTFEGNLTRADVPLMTCEGIGLQFENEAEEIEPGSCTVETTGKSFVQRLFRITPAGAMTEFPLKSTTALQAFGKANTITAGPSGNLWYTTEGITPSIGKFGIEPTSLTLKVNETGSGSGTVTSSPAGIECGGTCSAEFENGEEVTLTATPDKGSEFTGWSGGGCSGTGTCKVTISGFEEVEVEANFDKIPGPTNLVDLTITKSANGPGGTGTVSSKPKGIKCGTTCSSAVAAMYKSTPVELTAKPATGSAFVKWENAKEGGTCDGSTNAVCTVPMSEDTSLEAVFSGTSKTITPTEALTVSKGESTGKGTVKAAGLGCEADCTSTTVLYQGPPKAKLVVLKEAPAFGSKFIGWSGCTPVGETECEVTMSEAKEVVAEYEALPNKVLTLNKEYAKGNGSVSSKPKGIKCGTTCTQAVAQMPQGAEVELTAKPSSGTFLKWEGGDCNGKTELVCVVTMNTDETTKAVFSDPGKVIPEAKTLTLNKAGSGFGTVKASGLGCEVLCSSTSVLYQGPTTKPGKTVVLKAASAPGSKAVSWTGCDSIDGEGNCVVEMDENHTITATFDELE